MIEFYQTIISKLQKAFFLLFLKSSFSSFGKRSTLCFPFKVNGAKFIKIGQKVYIKEGAWLLCQKTDSTPPLLDIDDGTYIGRNAHVVCVRKMYIGKSVLIADNVYISDNLHTYEDLSVPIKSQKINYKGATNIGEHSWIGEKASIIGASVGKHCIIGSNSVVTKNIPDYSVAVGVPAKVIKKYNHQTQEWENCK